MELTRDEALALAKRSLKLAKRALKAEEFTIASEHADRSRFFSGMAKELGTFANGCETRIARIELADRPNPYVEAAIAAGWRQQEVYPRAWKHPGREYGYSSAAAVCEFEGLEVEKAA